MTERKGHHPNSRANLRRGNPGNRGNPLGRALTAAEFKGKARDEATRRIDVILEIIDSKASSNRDVLKAYELLAKYGGLDIQLIAQTDSDGNDVDLLDRDALLAIAKAAIQEEASGSPRE